MATSISIACIVLMSFMAMTSSNAFDLHDLCSETGNPSFCSKILSSNPRATKAVLHSLAHVTVDLARSNATSTRDHLVQWQNRTDNPQLRQRYTSCGSNYNDALAYFQQAKENILLGDYVALRDAAAGAMGKFNGCAEIFKQPPAEPSTLYQDTLDLLNFSGLILDFSKKLLQAK